MEFKNVILSQEWQKYMTVNEKWLITRYFRNAFLFTFNIIFTFSLFAQEVPNSHLVYIKELRASALLVKLPSYNNKIKFLEKQIELKTCKEDCKKSYRTVLYKTISQRNDFNQNFIRAMKNEFTFCSLYFCYDMDYPTIKKQRYQSNLYLTDSLTTDTIGSILSFPKIFVLKIEKTPEQSFDALLIETPEQRTLYKPFPYIRLNTLRTLFIPLTHYNDQDYQTSLILAKSLNKKLYRYYRKAVQSMSTENKE
jgi:hypothetical protein